MPLTPMEADDEDITVPKTFGQEPDEDEEIAGLDDDPDAAGDADEGDDEQGGGGKPAADDDDPIRAESRAAFGEGYDDLPKRTRKRMEDLLRERKAERDAAERDRRELAEMRGRWEAKEREQAEAASSAIETRLKEIAEAKKQASADADMEAFNTLVEEELELRERRIASRTAAPQREQAPAAVPAAGEKTPSQAWLERNPQFFQPGRFKARALLINEDLKEEGMKTSDPAFYEELDRRLAAMDAGAGRERQSGDDDDRSSRRSPAGGAGGREPPPPSGRPGAKRLSEADKTTMRKWGFDPDTAEGRKAWLQQNARL